MILKPLVLRLGPVGFAKEAWHSLEKVANVVTLNEDATRESFLKELRDPNGQFSKVRVIARTFDSARQTGRFDREVAEALPPSVVGVCHLGAGYDQIDTTPLKERRIQVTHVPGAVNNATADTHVFLLLGALRNFSAGIKSLQKGDWPAKGHAGGAEWGHDPEGHVVGILGLGGIGRTIVDRLKPFGFKKFIYHNRRRVSPELEKGCEYVSFDELLKQADIISINIPLNPNTRHTINADALAKMKDGVIIVNTARGGVIDEKALIESLKAGKVSNFAADVFEHEPEVPQELKEMPQVLALPHMGTATVETAKHMEEFHVSNVESIIRTGKGRAVVPEIINEQWLKDSKPLINAPL